MLKYIKEYSIAMEDELRIHWGIQHRYDKDAYIREPYPELDTLIEELENCLDKAPGELLECSQEELQKCMQKRVESLIKTYYQVLASRAYFTWKLKHKLH